MSPHLLSTQAIDSYTAHFQQRKKTELIEQQRRYQDGWKQAKIASQILKTHFGIREVFLFGSLLCPAAFDTNSDIDLAVERLPLHHYCDAVGILLSKVEGFNVDLIRLESSPSSLKTYILREGVKL